MTQTKKLIEKRHTYSNITHTMISIYLIELFIKTNMNKYNVLLSSDVKHSHNFRFHTFFSYYQFSGTPGGTNLKLLRYLLSPLSTPSIIFQ